MELEQLSLRNKIGFAMGHILQDLCDAIWFNYFVFFVVKVLKYGNVFAGVLILIGQVTNVLSSIIFSFVSDKDLKFFSCFGPRKTWHLIGCFCVIISFPFLFLDLEKS